jgi:hypothetical protein
LAARMRSALLATQSGISSARRSAPCSGSSAASVASARANQADTSAASFFHRLAHARIGHRLVHTGIGLNLSAAERHMSELHAIEREIEAHVAATERALADTPKMSDLEVARRTAFLLSNPLRKTERRRRKEASLFLMFRSGPSISAWFQP